MQLEIISALHLPILLNQYSGNSLMGIAEKIILIERGKNVF
jgi:hypothetical protein